jgi:hypothetical protein
VHMFNKLNLERGFILTILYNSYIFLFFCKKKVYNPNYIKWLFYHLKYINVGKHMATATNAPNFKLV